MNKFFGGVLVVALASFAWAAPQTPGTAGNSTGQPAVKHGVSKSAVKHTKGHSHKHNSHGNTVQSVK
jgi:hypothetical protein